VHNRVLIRLLEFEYLGVDPAEHESGQELPEFGDGVVFLHQEGAEDDASEVEHVHVHGLPPRAFPEYGEYESSGTVPPHVHADDDSHEGHDAQQLEFVVQGRVGQVRIQLVPANHPHIVQQEGCQAGHECVLQHRDACQVGDPEVRDHQSWRQQQYRRLAELQFRFICLFPVLEVLQVGLPPVGASSRRHVLGGFDAIGQQLVLKLRLLFAHTLIIHYKLLLFTTLTSLLPSAHQA